MNTESECGAMCPGICSQSPMSDSAKTLLLLRGTELVEWQTSPSGFAPGAVTQYAIRFTEGLGVNWAEDYHRVQKATWEDIANAIHSSVTMGDVIGAYCPDYEPRRNRIPCPLHNGKDYNFSFTSTGYKCFVCGESGDVIKFVQSVLSLRSRSDAMAKINDDFRLGLPLDREISTAENNAFIERRKALERKRLEKEKWEAGLDALWAEWCRLDRQKRWCKPGTAAHIEAIKNIDRISYEIDCYPPEPG